MIVKVKQEHIDAAIAMREEDMMSSSMCCPIAIALACDGYADAVVGCTRAHPYPGRAGVVMPMSAIRFVSAYDNCLTVKPFSFHLAVD